VPGHLGLGSDTGVATSRQLLDDAAHSALARRSLCADAMKLRGFADALDRPVSLASEASTGKATLTQRHARKVSDDQRAADHATMDAVWARGPIQLARDAHTGLGDDEARAAASHGIAGGGGSLPHFDAIQRSFGAHDVSGITAHVGGAAAEASERLGAHAYATGDHVAFAQSPDLHLAAHEAAHVVQQRAGVSLSSAVGHAGDAYERQADEVAARVVAGQSAADLLGAPSGGVGAGGVQRKDKAPAAAPGKLDLVAAGQEKGIRVGVALHHNAADEAQIIAARVGVSYKGMLAKYKDYAAKENYKTLKAKFEAEQAAAADPKTYDRVTSGTEGATFARFTLNNDLNFKATGDGWAKTHKAIGGSPPQIGKPVYFSEQPGDDALANVAAFSAAVGPLPDRHDTANIAELCFFTHGGRTKMKTGASFIGASAVASAIDKLLLPSVQIDLFACDVAGTGAAEGGDNHDEKEGKGTFADTLAHDLASTGHDGRIFGHETAAPATTNSRGREFNFGASGVTTADNWTMIFGGGFRESSLAGVIATLSAQDPALIATAFDRASRAWLAKDGMHHRVPGQPADETGQPPEASFAIAFAREATISFVQSLWTPALAAVEVASDVALQLHGGGTFVPPPGAHIAGKKELAAQKQAEDAAAAAAAKAAAKGKGKSKSAKHDADEPAHAPAAAAPTAAAPAAAPPSPAAPPATKSSEFLDDGKVAHAFAYYVAHYDQYPAEVVAKIIGKTRDVPPASPSALDRAKEIAHAAQVMIGLGIDESFVQNVARFQSTHSLKVDGVAGQKTIAAMFGADIRPEPQAAATAAAPAPTVAPTPSTASATSAGPSAPAPKFDGYDWTSLVSYVPAKKKVAGHSEVGPTISDEDRAKLRAIAMTRPAILAAELHRLGSRLGNDQWKSYKKGTKHGWGYGGESNSTPETSDRVTQLAMKELYADAKTLEAKGFNAIVTYDGTLSIGAGFADSMAAEYVHRWLAQDSGARAALLGAGFAVTSHREFLAIDETGAILCGNPARQYLRVQANGGLLDYVAGLMSQEGSAEKAKDAQMSLFMDTFITPLKPNVKAAMTSWTDEYAVRAAMHLAYWLPAGGPVNNPNDFTATGGNAVAMAKMFGKNMGARLRQDNGCFIIGANEQTDAPMGHFGRMGRGFLAMGIKTCPKIEMTFAQAGAAPELAGHVLCVATDDLHTSKAVITFYDLGAL
jgi:hypothetical protein